MKIKELLASKKIALLVAVGVGVLVVIGLVYWAFSSSSPFRESSKPSENSRDSSNGGAGGSGDQTYTNDEVDISFDYPSDWEIKQEYFYETAAGEKATVPTIILGRKSDSANATSNQISINLRQASCMGAGSVAYESAGSTKVAIYTQPGSSQKCAEATADGKDKNGKTTPYALISFFDDQSVKDVFIEVVKSFKATS